MRKDGGSSDSKREIKVSFMNRNLFNFFVQFEFRDVKVVI